MDRHTREREDEGVIARIKQKVEAQDDGIFGRLMEEHRQVETLIERIEASEDEEECDRLFEQLKQDVLTHAHAEDQIVYSRLQQEEELSQTMREAREEHALVEQVLEELDGFEGEAEVWMAKFKVLKDLIQHHVEEEEDEAIPRAKKLVDDDEAADLLEQFEAAKAQELGRLQGNGRKAARRSTPKKKAASGRKSAGGKRGGASKRGGGRRGPSSRTHH
jgi:hemerythrin superfamily protein